MLAEARQRLAREEAGVRQRVRLVGGTGERTHETLGGEMFDAVLCHGVLMYLEDPQPWSALSYRGMIFHENSGNGPFSDTDLKGRASEKGKQRKTILGRNLLS